MNQIVTVAKISGEAATVVVRLFQHWSEARKHDTENRALVEPGQWPANCRAEMANLAEGIRSGIGQPPIVFHSEHVDMWSMGDVFTRGFPENGNVLYAAMSDDLDLLCYALPDGNALAEHLRRELRRRHFAEETKWYLHVLQEAVSAWQPLADMAAIVVLRRVLGGLVEDREVEEANRAIPQWLKGCHES